MLDIIIGSSGGAGLLGRNASAGGSVNDLEAVPGQIPGAFASLKLVGSVTGWSCISPEGFSSDGDEKLELELGLGCRSWLLNPDLVD